MQAINSLSHIFQVDGQEDTVGYVAAIPWEEAPYRLVSWWDMEEFSASEFYKLFALLQDIIRMNDVIDKLSRAKPSLADIRDIMLIDMNPQGELPLASRLTAMTNACGKIGLRDSAEAISEFNSLLSISKGTITIGEVAARIAEIKRVIQREMKRHLFLHIPIERARYCQSWGEAKRKERGEEIPLFGDAVNDKFPSATYDVVEAGNSFAAGRYTACVFHLMRALEIGLTVLAKVFNVPSDHTNWHNIIEAIEKQIRNMGNDPNKSSNWKDDQEFYSQAASHFFILKEAWRNYTAHARGKYNPEEAERIMMNTRFFIQKLSERLAE
jgi:hypothetical protein